MGRASKVVSSTSPSSRLRRPDDGSNHRFLVRTGDPHHSARISATRASATSRPASAARRRSPSRRLPGSRAPSCAAIVPASAAKRSGASGLSAAASRTRISCPVPGGSPAAAYLHLGRTITRRAERLVTELAASEAVSAPVIAYLNRLSDLLFVLARACNDNGAGDVLWVPGANR